MKLVWFSAAIALMATPGYSSSIETQPEMEDDVDYYDLANMLAQTEAEVEQLPSAANPIAQAKESMKELKQMVEQDDAKKMGYAEYNVFKKLRAEFRKRGKKSDEIFRKLKSLLKNGWEGKKTLDKLEKGSGGSDKPQDGDKKEPQKDSDKSKQGEKEKKAKKDDKKKKAAKKK